MADPWGTTTWPEIFGERIRSRRRELDWTQEYLARQIKRSKRHLAQIEAGKTNFSFQIAVELAFALGIDAAELARGLTPLPPARTRTPSSGSHS